MGIIQWFSIDVTTRSPLELVHFWGQYQKAMKSIIKFVHDLTSNVSASLSELNNALQIFCFVDGVKIGKYTFLYTPALCI